MEGSGVRSMFIGKRVMLLLSVLACVLLLLPDPAFAGRVTFQGNSSVQFNGNTQVRACDGDPDGKAAYSHLFSFNNTEGFTYDNSGANDGVCGNSGVYPSQIRQHNICEDIPLQPDRCSSWSRH